VVLFFEVFDGVVVIEFVLVFYGYVVRILVVGVMIVFIIGVVDVC